MTIFTLVGLWIIWLMVAALLLRWMVRSAITCCKHSDTAKLGDWAGFVCLISVGVAILAALG